jgi:phosphate transport system substrate-binding protein
MKVVLLLLGVFLLSSCSNQNAAVSSNGAIASPDPYKVFEEKEPQVRPELKNLETQKKTYKDLGVLPRIDPLKVEGDLVIVGSATVSPLTYAIYDKYVEEGYRDLIKIYSNGSGAGFKLFCQKNGPDLTNASRAIKPEEQAECAKAGRNVLEFRMGTDAIAIVVNPANKFLKNVTKEELAKIFTAEKWSDVNPAWPKEPIARYSPDSDSGTFDFFVEKIFDGKSQMLLNGINNQFSADPNDLVQGVTDNEYAISFFGYSFYQSNADRLKLVSVEGVLPDANTLDNYELARPLFFYADANTIKTKPQVEAFVNYYLSNVQNEIIDVGYFPTSETNLIKAQKTFMQALGLLEEPKATP